VTEAGGYASLDQADKLVACQWFLVESGAEREARHLTKLESDPAWQDPHKTSTERTAEAARLDQVWSTVYHGHMVSARERRVRKATAILLNHVGPLNGLVIAKMLEDLGLIKLYTNWGNKGLQQGSPYQGLYDYLYSYAGTDFESDGLLEETYPLAKGTYTSLRDDIIQILDHGQ